MRLKLIVCAVVMALCPLWLLAADDGFVVAVRGAVEVRHGVSDEWKNLAPGDTLRVEDTIRTGKNAIARIIVEGKQIRIPQQTIVDVSDFRYIGLEEFLLRLTMENILSIPPRDDGSVAIVAAAETTEGKESPTAKEAETEQGMMLLQGAKLLYEHAFYATSILQTKEAFRLYPELRSDLDARMKIAYSFESMKLMNEALTVYSGLLAEPLPENERAAVHRAIERIRTLQNRQ